MSQMKWTPAQESALSARGGSLLLSAAAGSGKTAVLVARIIRRITDPDDPTDVNAFLVLTFTRSAAAEMRSRIGEALSQELSGAARALETAPTEENRRRAAYLQRQLTLLGSASISTIDAFCQSVLRQYFYLLDMDPDFRILSDENEKYLLQDEVLSEVFLSWYEKDDPRFRDCVDLFSSGYQDTNLRETVRRIYEFSRSLAFPEEFLRRLALPYGVQAAETPDDLPWTAELLASFRDAAASWESKYREILRAIESDEDFFAPYKEAVSDEYAAISYLASGRCRTWGEWHSAVQAVTFRRLKPLPKKESTEDRLRRKEDIARLRDAVKKGVKDLADTYFSIPPAQWLSDLSAAAPIAQVLSEVLLDFSRAYEARKKKEGLLEFNDMEHLVLRLLLAEGSAPDRLIPSETALALRKKYREVMVDEYQDTNDLQEIITALISDGKNRFLVGDIKQSIYRFRQADPGIFLRKYETFREGENGRRIDLNQNFRSDPAVLTAANFIFRQLLRKDGGRPSRTRLRRRGSPPSGPEIGRRAGFLHRRRRGYRSSRPVRQRRSGRGERKRPRQDRAGSADDRRKDPPILPRREAGHGKRRLLPPAPLWRHRHPSPGGGQKSARHHQDAPRRRHPRRVRPDGRFLLRHGDPDPLGPSQDSRQSQAGSRPRRRAPLPPLRALRRIAGPPPPPRPGLPLGSAPSGHRHPFRRRSPAVPPFPRPVPKMARSLPPDRSRSAPGGHLGRYGLPRLPLRHAGRRVPPRAGPLPL